MKEQGVCQSHCGLAIYIKKYLKKKEELWKLKKIIVKVLMATWRSEISDCVLSPQAYLH
jgi:hypothetical protein